MKNIILNTDSYKVSHYLQYPPGTEIVNSYIEARGSVYPDIKKTVFFGLQAYLKEYLSKPITQQDIDEAEEIYAAHGEPFNKEGWQYILDAHGGNLPVYIEAIPEGTSIEIGNALVQIRNVDHNVPWLTSYLETSMLRAVWYPTSVATYSYYIKKDMLEYANKCGTDPEAVLFKLHDFGARGVSSNESAMIGGLAHLVNFRGTDTVAALVAGRRWYDEPMAGFSIPAAEHSTITVWGEDGEVDAYKNMLKQFAKPGSLVAVVSDSYDVYNAAEKIWGELLKDEVCNSGATVIVRPDSGDPVQVPIDIIEILMDKFGFTVNERGYRVLPDCIRVIQGDGINRDSIRMILAKLDEKKIALDNIAFGMGGALLQQVNRDTFKFAMKASWAKINDVPRDVYKQPATDSGKSSKRGVLVVNKNKSGVYYTTQQWERLGENQLEPVYQNGEIIRTQTLSDVRDRAII